MGSLKTWTIMLVLFQAMVFSIIGYLNINCKLYPRHNQFHEITLIQLLYLYDPGSCGRIYFYNYTTYLSESKIQSTVIWPNKNSAARAFRNKVRIWLVLHFFWIFFYVLYLSVNQKLFGFYGAMVPFLLTGIGMLIIDIVYAVLFLNDTQYTKTETDILDYIDGVNSSVQEICLKEEYEMIDWVKVTKPDDTSWISLLMAFLSCRCVVVWMINFWIVKDNFEEGLILHNKVNKLFHMTQKQIKTRKSASFLA